MLAAATWWPASGPAVTGLQVAFKQPDLVLGEMVESTEYEIEYQTADMPELSYGDRIEIGGVLYLVRRNPEKRGDGTFSVARLGAP